MKTTTELISKNVKRLRKLKELSQKEVSASCSIPQAQYSRIENGKVEPSISSLEKIAGVFEVSLGEFFKSDSEEEQINLPLIEKIKLIDQLEEDEKMRS